MSKYITYNDVKFKQLALLKKALIALGWDESQIEIHVEPKNLFGFHGDVRPEKAQVIIRRKHIGRLSNDIGFVWQQNGYVPIISEYDAGVLKQRRGESNDFVAALKLAYAKETAFHVAQRLRGRATVSRVGNTDQIVVHF